MQASSGNDRQQHARHHVKTSSVGDLQPSLPRPLHVVQRPDASILSNIQRSVNDSSSQSQEGSHDEVHEERCMLETDLNAELAYRQELINHLQAGNEVMSVSLTCCNNSKQAYMQANEHAGKQQALTLLTNITKTCKIYIARMELLQSAVSCMLASQQRLSRSWRSHSAEQACLDHENDASCACMLCCCMHTNWQYTAHTSEANHS